MLFDYKTNSSFKSFTYQHLHGIMLYNLNIIACELKLTHTEYRLMGILIGYWNKQQGKSFPTIKILAKQSCMSNSTVLKSLKHLTELGLILIAKDGKNGRQNYYLNQHKFLNENKTVTNTV
ncbi:MAG: helix-turn-helix domain-containing protein, partial [Vampirovibrionia bacterium]